MLFKRIKSENGDDHVFVFGRRWGAMFSFMHTYKGAGFYDLSTRVATGRKQKPHKVTGWVYVQERHKNASIATFYENQV